MAKMFYTLEEAAVKLGTDEQSVKDMAARNELQQFRDGDKLIFKVDQVDLLAESHDVFQLASVNDYRAALRFAVRRPRRIAYLVAMLLGVKKAITASSRELLSNIESLLQQACPIENTVKVNAMRDAQSKSALLARTGEG